MAKVNQICACVFLLVLMFYYGIICIEARSLKNKKRDCKNYATVNGKVVRDMLGKNGCKNNRDLHGDFSEEAADSNKPTAEESYNSPPSVDGADTVISKSNDMRPTAPGHSPGAGHSTGPSSIGPNH